MNEQTKLAIELAQAVYQASLGLEEATRALVAMTDSDIARACSWMLREAAHRASELGNELQWNGVTVKDNGGIEAITNIVTAIDEVARALKGVAWVATRLSGDVNYAQFANALEYTSKRAEELEQWLYHNAAKSFEDKEVEQ